MAEQQNPDGMPRRSFLRDGALVAASVPPILLAGVAPASAAVPAYDPQQRFIRLVGGGNGVVYAIQADGSLYWYRHLGWESGTSSWASGSGRKIGSGWHEYQTVFGSTNGSLYGVRGDGTVHHHRYDLSDPLAGTGSWFSGGQIGTGFDRYPRLCGFDGAIYGQDADGQLFWHQYSPSRRTWTATGMRIGRGFQGAVLQADVSGVIYAYRYGPVHWHRHLGKGVWARGSGLRILGGLRDAAMNDGVWFTGQGVLYTIPPDPPTSTQTGTIRHQRLINHITAGPDGAAVWLNRGSATKVGTGWTVQTRAGLQGYPNTTSVLQGETLRVAVSTGFPSITASMVRLAPNTGAPQVVSPPMRVTGGVQSLPAGFIRVGCGWSDRIQLRIPADWQPGLYAARLEGPYRLHRYVPFIVRPTEPTNQIAVLLPTFTYNAYNTWGGHNQYCTDTSGPRPLSLRRPSSELNVDDPAIFDHTLWSDLMLLRWMSEQGLAFDCYEDADLHASGSWLTRYRVLVLGSHPEYWSEAMRQHLVNYQAGGGRLIYAGGNGIYERVRVDAGRTVVTYRRSDGGRDLYTELGLPASQLLGVNYASAGSYAPYRVVRNHRLLAGTGLTGGSRFGFSGYNGAASGWEMDARLGLAGEASLYDVIARGENPGGGAAMVFMKKPNGALVFSASSIAFAGALGSDPALSTLFRNVFTRMLEPGPAVTATEAPMQRTSPTPAVPEPFLME